MSTTKADAVLAQLDRIKATIDDAQRILGISPQPIMQWFGPPCPVWLALATAACGDRDRQKLMLLMERVPEPEEFTRNAHHKGRRKAVETEE